MTLLHVNDTHSHLETWGPKDAGLGGDYSPQVSGLRLKYDSRLVPGSQVLVDSVLVGEEKLVADNPYTVTVTEGVFALVKTLMPVYDMVTLETLAFDAARALVVEPGEPGPMASNRIRDIGAIPGKSRWTSPSARADCGLRSERRCPA